MLTLKPHGARRLLPNYGIMPSHHRYDATYVINMTLILAIQLAGNVAAGYNGKNESHSGPFFNYANSPCFISILFSKLSHYW